MHQCFIFLKCGHFVHQPQSHISLSYLELLNHYGNITPCPSLHVAGNKNVANLRTTIGILAREVFKETAVKRVVISQKIQQQCGPQSGHNQLLFLNWTHHIRTCTSKLKHRTKNKRTSYSRFYLEFLKTARFSQRPRTGWMWPVGRTLPKCALIQKVRFKSENNAISGKNLH